MSTASTNPSPGDPILRMQQVSIVFGSQRVLENINLDTPRGQTIVIIGESGCGKTVLLKLLIGLLQPTAGKVIFDSQDLAALGERQLTRARLRFGFLFQASALFDSMSVFDNVAFGLRYQKELSETQIQERVRQRLEEVGLSLDMADKKPGELSGGMKKRVGLARALALNPEVMLYDEPTTGLDPIMSAVINDLIVQTRQRHPVTGVVVTHDMRTVNKVADRVVMLYPLDKLRTGENQILFDGTPAQLEQCQDVRVRQFVEGKARTEPNVDHEKPA
jgi:phospholipid/cholesterol/gamma-HCH transport system ATP-binding protein